MGHANRNPETEQDWLAAITVEIDEAHRMLDECLWPIPRADRWGVLSLAERVGMLVDMVGAGGPSGVASGVGR